MQRILKYIFFRFSDFVIYDSCMPKISCSVFSFVCCCLVCHCLEKFQFQPRSIRFDFKFNVCNGWIFQDQKVGGSSPVKSELHYISSRTLTLGITNNCKYFIHLFSCHVFEFTFLSSWKFSRVYLMTDNAQGKPDSNVNFLSCNKQTMTLENKNVTSWSDPAAWSNTSGQTQKNLKIRII